MNVVLFLFYGSGPVFVLCSGPVFVLRKWSYFCSVEAVLFLFYRSGPVVVL